jgi:5-methylcytosine-specific restriction protein B
MMRDNSCVAIGWKKTGDLSWLDGQADSKERLKKKLDAVYPDYTPTGLGNDCSQICQFVTEMTEGDIVLAASGMTILGVGRLKGEYQYHSKFEFPHQRKVEWLSKGEWKMPLPKEGLQSTVREIRKYGENLLAIEGRIWLAGKDPPINEGPPETPANPSLSQVSTRIQSVLDRKGQVILYGPPGTGKTYWAERTAMDLSALSQFGQTFGLLQPEQQKVVAGDGEVTGNVRLCCFHPAYGYEDFLEGYRPATVNGQVTFQLRDGVFKRLCKDAAARPNQNFYLIIDEINRGDIPRIFGELLTVIEKDKRGKRIILPVSQEHLTIPDNVFLIGTMNTADRSISLLDAALRRRFGFVELMPDGMLLKDHSVLGIPLKAWFDALNQRIREHVGRDARNLQIGHSYFLHKGAALKDFSTFKRSLRDDVIPLLEEYCYDNFQALELILGDQLVDTTRQRICHELFDEGAEDELRGALLAPCPEIMSTSDAVTADEGEQTHLPEYDDAAEDEDDL